MYSIRTAHAFGLQKVLGALYQGHVDKSVKAGIDAARFQSVGLALMFTIINGGYALAFAWVSKMLEWIDLGTCSNANELEAGFSRGEH